MTTTEALYVLNGFGQKPVITISGIVIILLSIVLIINGIKNKRD